MRPDSEVVSYKTDEGRGEFPRERNKPVEKSTLNTIYPKSTAHVHIVYISHCLFPYNENPFLVSAARLSDFLMISAKTTAH